MGRPRSKGRPVRSEAEMFTLVRRIRFRRRARLGASVSLVVLVVLGLGVALSWPAERTDTVAAESGQEQTIPESSSSASTAAGEAIVPDLVGLDLEEALGRLRDTGFSGQPALIESRYVANDDIARGVVVAQDVDPGAPLSAAAPVPIEVSAGGPARQLADLPPEARTLAEGLASFDGEEPILEVTTDVGVAYKTDRWLFGPCAAVDAAYRTFADPAYDRQCY